MYNKRDWQSAFVPCGIQKGDNLIITGTLSHEQNTIDGWPTLLEACLSMVGRDGTLMTIVRSTRSEPILTQRTISETHRQKYIQQWCRSSYSLVIANPCELAFLLHDETRKLTHPGYRFYAIGKYAAFILRKVSKHFPLHDDGPLQSARKVKVKNIHFGDDDPWLFMQMHADNVVVSGGVVHLDGIAHWENFLDKTTKRTFEDQQPFLILDEKVRIYGL